MLVNYRLKSSAVLHNVLHGFIKGIGMETSTLEANLDQNLAGILHKPLFQVFLDVRKTYDSMNMEQCLELLRGYRLGTNLARILNNY